MNALPETTNMSSVMYREWFPQIMYNHHQTGPAGAVMFAPPFRDPFNYNFHPDDAGQRRSDRIDHCDAVHRRGQAGRRLRKGASYSTWWNGGLRTTAYFHNQIGILTETIGNPDADAALVESDVRHADPRVRGGRSRRSGGTSASRLSTRSRPIARSSTSRRAIAKRTSIASTRWARTRLSGATKTTGR